jgi:hypothetical protein
MKTSKLALIALFLLLVPSVTLAQIIFPNRGGTGTTTIPSKGQVLVGKANGTYGPVSTSSLGISGGGGGVTRVGFTVPTGFSISGVPITSSGTGTLTYSSGYEGFKTASGTAWNSFYVTPSTRITAGDAIDWVGNTLNVITSGDWTGTLDTYNASDLLARVNHTGTQLASTISDFVATVRTSISETITGITYNNSTGVFSLDASYTIPTTTLMSNLGTFYNTPSNRITAATGIDWTSNTLNVTLGDFTTANLSESGNLYYTDARARSAISETVTGLDYTSGTGVFSATTGFSIPTTTLLSNVGTYYNTPSTRISDGTGLTWSGNTLNCDTASGSIQGCLTSANWTTFNNKVASTAIDTSLELNNLITDQTGSNRLVFSGAPAFSGTTTFSGIFATGTASATRIRANHATTTNLGITSRLSFGGVSGSAWSTFCTAITGGASLCDGVDATGGGGGSISTSTAVTAGNLARWTGANTLSQVATGTLTETTSGLEFSATRGLVGGASILSLTSGFSIPTTTFLANTGTFYNTPSNRITDGTGLTWSTNTLNCDTANGSTQGCLTSTDWTSFNGRVATSAINTLAEIETLTGVSNILIENDIDASSELSALMDDETGTNRLVFSGAPAFSGTSTFAGIFATGTASTTRIRALHSTTTNLGITSRLSFNGVTGTTWASFCTAITGGSGLCDGVDATGGGGGGSIGTSTAVSANNLAYWTSNRNLSQVATGTLTETVSGLELNATRGLIGGAGILSLTSGFSIPTTTLLANVGTFYNTPSNRITDGSGLTWTGNTIDCDTASAAVFGCLSSANWTIFNGKVASSAIDTSLELNNLVTDQTGSGALVFGTSPTFTTGITLGSDTIDDFTGFGLALSSGDLGLLTTGATDGECLVYESTGPTIDWTTCGGGGGSSKWTDSGSFTYLTADTDDLVLGSTATNTAPFWFDVSDSLLNIGTGGAGDSFIELAIAGVSKWVFGVDDSDNDNFVISAGGALGTNNALVIADNGTSTFSDTVNITDGADCYAIAGVCLDNYRKYVEFFSDFMQETAATNGNESIWYESITGASAACTSQTIINATNRPGYATCTTGSTATGRAGWATTLGVSTFGAGTTTFQTNLRITGLSTSLQRYQFLAGFFDTAGANQVDGAYILYDEGGVTTGSAASANWQCITASNSVRTATTTSSVVAINTDYTLTVRVNAAGTQARFFVDNTNICTINTNIPTGTARAFGHGVIMQKSVGTTGSGWGVDYMYAKHEFTTAR